MKTSQDRKLWRKTTPANGRNCVIVETVQDQCRRIASGDIVSPYTARELAARFMLERLDGLSENEISSRVDRMRNIVENLLSKNLTPEEKALRKRKQTKVRPGRTKKGPNKAETSLKTIAIAEKALNRFFKREIDHLPSYKEIADQANPGTTRENVRRILQSSLPPEAKFFFYLDRKNHWQNVADMLHYAGNQAKRRLADPTFYVESYVELGVRFNLDHNRITQIINAFLPAEEAEIYRHPMPYKNTRYIVRFLSKIARAHHSDPLNRLPTQDELAQRFNKSTTTISALSRRWLPPELSTLWTDRKIGFTKVK